MSKIEDDADQLLARARQIVMEVIPEAGCRGRDYGKRLSCGISDSLEFILLRREATDERLRHEAEQLRRRIEHPAP